MGADIIGMRILAADTADADFVASVLSESFAE